MATTTKIPKVKVDVLVDNIALQQYEDDEEGQVSPATVTKYIEAQSGAEFVLRNVFDEKPKYDVKVRVYMDGSYVCGEILRLKGFHKGTYKQTIDGARSTKDGMWVLAKFSFSDLKTVDSISRPCKDRLVKDLKELGQISVKFNYITNLRPSTSALPTFSKGEGFDEVPEKALKGTAISHQVLLRDPIPTGGSSFLISDYVDPDRRPFLTVNFKYRSRAALKSLLIIPRSPSPVPLEERDVDSLSLEETRELIRRQREREAAALAVKRERGIKRGRSRERSRTVSDFDGGNDVSFISAKRLKLPVTLNEDGAEMIDLT
ncbi:hypothetical protein BDU57DRAFT_545226 [Ampelomyces quisqualis]|uniref:DUF7918 domain-containing protein n=1 Tax=Ampelomyces quisqualis TaxID=50730 RepID=A0A6A5R184_AMPQU|nr:hypothetical protein BDU57DRAFT_545226 [Ampelomyces quisqualis]